MKPFKADAKLQNVIDKFNALNSEDKLGDYWNNNHEDKELNDLKGKIKEHYLDQQDHRCAYCRKKNDEDHKLVWDTEHILDKSKYARFMFESKNLCVSCKSCNSGDGKGVKRVLESKKDKRVTLPDKSIDYIFSHPHLDDYYTNITIIETAAGDFYKPNNRKGQKTVEICALLRFSYKYTIHEKDNTNQIIDITKCATVLAEQNDPYVIALLLTRIKDAAIDALRKDDPLKNIVK